jgi:translation initiation factor IF-2
MTDRIIAMTSSNDTDASKKPLKLSRPKLELKKTVDAGQVRQSFPHGRTKTVAVEVKRKRTYARGNGDKVTEVTTEPELTAPADMHGHAPAVAEAPAAAAHHLTEGERAVRLKALGEAKRDDEIRRQAEIETARQRAEEEARRAAEEAARPKLAPVPEPEAVPAIVAEVAVPGRAKPAPEREREGEVKPHRLTAKPAAAAVPVAEEEESDRARRPGAVRHAAPKPAPVARREEPRRRTGKITISQALDEDAGERVRSLAAVRRAREKERRLAMAAGESAKVIRDVVIPETITVQELANRMAERGADVIKALMKMGIMATINQTLDADTAELVAGEFGHRVRRVSAADVEIGVEGLADEAAHMAPRWPVVTVMGHVDHGKTSLLDALRQTDVAAHEAGGITQHIGAYQVTRASGQKITFIDTPGHAAFTEMRARGANVTDIVVLVVAADDGIMEQTVEAIHHAKAAKVPIIVAINKIDKPEANPNRVRQDLLKHELVVEELGGDIQTVEVSAKTKQGLDRLEEAILLQAEILELKANPDRAAAGAVIEAKLERGRGVVATLLVQRGTLRVGDILVAGGEWGRVRALLNDRGDTMSDAGPSTPAEILGLQGAPLAGDTFAAVETEAKARQVSEYRQRVQRDKEAATRVRGSAQDIFAKIAEGEAK